MSALIRPLVTLTFKDIFQDENKINHSEILRHIPGSTIIKIISHFMVRIHANEENLELQHEIILSWLNQQEDEIKASIMSRFYIRSKEVNSQIVFFNNITTLYFYQTVFSNYNKANDRALTAEEELKLFKIYLQISDDWTEKEISYIKERPQSDEEMVEYILPFHMVHNEVQSYKDFRLQLIKSIYFFRFIESDNELGQYLSDFLLQYGLSNWPDYIRHAIIPYILSISGQRSSVLAFKASDEIETEYWDTFCIDIENYRSKPDFLELREFPVLKTDMLHYVYFNYNFVIDKLFQSFQFVFSKLLINKGVVGNFGDFKTRYYSERFAENYMLYNVVDNCISNQCNIIAFNGEQLASKLGEKGPDYYIRLNNYLIIIEFKDVLMGALPKASYNCRSSA